MFLFVCFAYQVGNRALSSPKHVNPDASLCRQSLDPAPCGSSRAAEPSPGVYYMLGPILSVLVRETLGTTDMLLALRNCICSRTMEQMQMRSSFLLACGGAFLIRRETQLCLKYN